MCRTCGCSAGGHAHHGTDHHHHEPHEHTHEPREPTPRAVQLELNLLAKNDRLAADNRSWLQNSRIVVLNLIGSPGAGKTLLLEETIRRMSGELPLAVLEGDQATSRDAERIERAGCRVVQINTGAGCHLDATMVADGLRQIEPPRGSVIFVENVGNLVCPALFDLGERAKVVVMSVTEGEDKPLKYPHVFRAADVMVLTKMDLIEHVEFDVEECVRHARSMNPRIGTLCVSARRGEGMDSWCAWVRAAAARSHDGPYVGASWAP